MDLMHLKHCLANLASLVSKLRSILALGAEGVDLLGALPWW
jgi:hypothetical protein